MKKPKLYYTIEKEISSDLEDELTGNKTITVYEIIDNEPSKFFGVECNNCDDSKEAIQDYLNDNGYSDTDFELVQL